MSGADCRPSTYEDVPFLSHGIVSQSPGAWSMLGPIAACAREVESTGVAVPRTGGGSNYVPSGQGSRISDD